MRLSSSSTPIRAPLLTLARVIARIFALIVFGRWQRYSHKIRERNEGENEGQSIQKNASSVGGDGLYFSAASILVVVHTRDLPTPGGEAVVSRALVRRIQNFSRRFHLTVYGYSEQIPRCRRR